MTTPQVSFVLPVYNAAQYVGAAIESVLTQTYGDFELIIVNDGSTDGSRDIIAAFKDDRIRVLDQANCGLVPTLNRGVREARAAWIARMDADDISLPRRLEMQMEWLRRNPEVMLLGGFVSTIDEDGRVLSDEVQFPKSHEQIWEILGRRPWVMCHPTVMFHRQTAIDIGLYHPAYKHAEDAEFFGRMMTRHRAANLPATVLQYRLRPDAVCTEFKDHGRINAELVARIIDRWHPGVPFEATSKERAEADDMIRRTARQRGMRSVQSTYHCRIGRELLRGSRWFSAAAAYARAASWQPWRLLPYAGLIAACLHLGAAVPFGEALLDDGRAR